MAALIWRDLHRLKNALRRTARSPGRLAVTILIAVGFLFAMLGQVVLLLAPAGRNRRVPFDGLLQVRAEHVEAVLLAVLLLISYSVLRSGLQGRLLVFEPADVDFLFPAPISRASVLLYEMGRDYAKLLGYVLFITFFLMPQLRLLGAQHPATAIVYTPLAVALYLILLLNLGNLAAILATFHGQRLRRLPIALTLGFVLVLLFLALAALGRAGSGQWLQSLPEVLRSPAAMVLLFPVVVTWEALAAPFVGLPPAAGLKLAGLLLFAAGSMALLLSRRENIYEPTVGVSLVYGQVRAAMRAGDFQTAQALRMQGRRQRRPGLSVPAFGTGGMVLVWRDLALGLRRPQRALITLGLFAVLLPLGLRLLAASPTGHSILRMLPLFAVQIAWGAGTALFMLQRADLRRANILKPLPNPAWQVVLAQVLPTGLGAGAMAAVVLLAVGVAVPGVDPRLSVAVALALPPLLLLLGAAGMGMGILFPDAADAAQSTVASIIWSFGSALLIGVLFAGGAIIWALGAPGWMVGLGTGAVSLVLAAAAIAVASRLYRRFDPTE